MNKRDFTKALNKISKTVIDVDKIKLLSDTERKEMVEYLVRNRYASNCSVLKDLVPSVDVYEWLLTMGYLYQTKTKDGLTFVHTCEARFK